MWENTTPSTELLRDFCAGIGPLQLGVVLVVLGFKSWKGANLVSFLKMPAIASLPVDFILFIHAREIMGFTDADNNVF